MSTFKVQINNKYQGKLDVNGITGVENDPSIQRTVYITGPNKINRLLKDGDEFEDCNYYKRYAFPQCSLEDAIVTVLDDDGSVYSNDPTENTFPKVYNITALASSTYDDNQADILTDTGGVAIFTQITNNGSNSVQVKLNGLSGAIFSLLNDATQIFNARDLTITKIEIDNSASGSVDADIQIIVSVQSGCNS